MVNSLRLNVINPRVLKIDCGLRLKMFDSAPFTAYFTRSFYSIRF